MYTNYNIDQFKLDISLDYIPEKHHVAHFINGLVDSLAIHHPYEFGRPREYSLAAVLKLLLFAYTRGVFTSRKINLFVQENMPARWLTQDGLPSPSTICRCRRAPELQAILDKGFESLVDYLREHRLIDDQMSIDGTKLLADANKYSFVWKKNTIRFDESNQDKIKELLVELKAAYAAAYLPADTPMTLDGLEEVITILETRLADLEVMVQETATLSPNPAKQERRKVKSVMNKIKERREKHQNYLEQSTTFGERNSYSKTDTDATFMRMKDDHMMNGQLKPGYNLQLATSNQYALAYSIYPNPTDTRTLQPFLTTHERLIHSMSYLSMDAGYGSEANYRFLEDCFPNITALIPYGTMLKEQTKKWLTDEKKVMNWQYDEFEDYYTDPQGVRFNFTAYRQRTDKYGMSRDFKEYKAERYTPDNREIPEALTEKGYVRKIMVNPSWEYFKAKQRTYFSTPECQAVYQRRKIDVETTFGFLKGSLGFTRCHVRGKEKVSQEIGIALMACNLHKLSLNAQKNKVTKEKQKI